ncbi:DUF2478 domain-containing protein [Candidatus Micrarchaeota archaeon]|nr:DUF2478 domain-containing protein [Candidatus Micrarchaeota archaeon]
MPSNLFISGIPKAGKTTLLHRMISELKQKGVKIGGFISPADKSHGATSGFHVMNIENGKIARLADTKGSGPKVNKYYIDVQSFEDLVLPILKSPKKYDLIVIDEIGVMELKSRKFSDALDNILESNTPVLASLHNDFFDEYAELGEVIELEEGAREIAYGEIKNKVWENIKMNQEKNKKPEIKSKSNSKMQESTKKNMKSKSTGQKKQSKTETAKTKAKPTEQRKIEPKEEKKGFFDTVKSWFGID